MNRPVPGPQSLRGMPSGFPNTQQLPQNRSATNRIPNGKMATNGSTWSAFGGGVPMGSVGLPTQRTNTGSMTSFAQTIGGAQTTQAPLDLSEFPSLSNNSQQAANSTPSLWASSGARNISQITGQRQQQQSMLLTHQQTQAQQQTQQQQDDLFSSSSQLPTTQANFRFGGQNAVGQAQPSASDDFPPLSGNVNGDIGQGRASGLLQGFGGAQGATSFTSGIGSSSNAQSNGLLSALSSSSRAPPAVAQASSPTSIGVRLPSEEPSRNLSDAENSFSRAANQSRDTQALRPDSQSLQSAVAPSGSQTTDCRLSSRPEQMEKTIPEVEDPLAGFSDKDRFGLKGLTAILNSYPDQAALIGGLDLPSYGFDIAAGEPVTNMIWSPFDDAAPRPPIPQYILPECYNVHNVQQIENKMNSFSDETLMYMFYSNPQDIQQIMAATELANRNWRYHKKLQLWLTKDEMMVPQSLGEQTERGYYIFFNKLTWAKERRELVLNYADLEVVVPNGRLIQ